MGGNVHWTAAKGQIVPVPTGNEITLASEYRVRSLVGGDREKAQMPCLVKI